MRTLLISDLHLGSSAGSDLLRAPALRAPLLDRAREADRLALLGDVLELRHGPPRTALAAARPVFEDLGRALADRELVIMAGNHDHALVEPWLERRGEQDALAELALEQLVEPAQASPMLERIAEWAAPARVRAAYPGIWVRADIYATHGHYLDCHLTVPTLERLSVALMSRLLARPASSFANVQDYETVTAPVYEWRTAVARDLSTGSVFNGRATLRAWQALGGSGRRPRGAIGAGLQRRALVGAFPLAVAALNRAGLGPLRSEISGSELRRAGLRAMGEVTSRLGLGDAHVVFGHTHRAGPLPGDAREEWIAPPPAPGAGPQREGARLMNAGSWAYDSIFLTPTPGESPYWPGGCVTVRDEEPPVLERLLEDRPFEELREARRRARASA